ncbi:phage regulatory CII family protein [Cupriavidus basilensis]
MNAIATIDVRQLLSVEDAAYHCAHGTAGGVPALATRMGRSANTLQNKLNPSQDHHKLTLKEAAEITSLTGDARIVDAMASLIGRISVPVPQLGDLSDGALLDLVGKLLTKQGAMFNEFTSRYADGDIDAEDFRVLDAGADQLIQCVMEWKKRVELIHRAGEERGRVAMPDIADLAGERADALEEAVIADAHRVACEQAARRALECSCRFCAEPTTPGVPFCGIECRDDFDREQRASRRNGRGIE